MQLFDTHAHYDDHAFDADRDAVLSGLPSQGVALVVNPGCDVESSRKAVELAAQFPHVYAAVGLHPENCGGADDADFATLRTLAAHPKVVAIGEIGLDYYWPENPPRDFQQNVFRRQLSLAQQLQLPVIVHDRDAHGDCMSIIREFPDVRGVFHCYSGSVEDAKILLSLGWYLGFDGPITYKNARKAPEVIAATPMDRILIETDSPYLPPIPHRGQRNDSSLVSLVAEKIAALKGLSTDEVAAFTLENGKRLFGIKDGSIMTITYVYGNNLYVNSTNRCDCRCVFCLRSSGDGVGSADSLWLEREPTKEEILSAILAEPLEQYEQVVFCGYGEPTYRLDDILWVCEKLKALGITLPLRMDTNGHGDLICEKATAPLMAGKLDILSISLNDSTAEAYDKRVRSSFGPASFAAILDFTREAVKYVPSVLMTVVDNMPAAEIEDCRKICEDLGATFRVRHYSTNW